jgi:hypothetical protein
MKKKSKAEMEEQIMAKEYLEYPDTYDPALKLHPAVEIIRSGSKYIDNDGCITFKVNTAEPRGNILYLINEFIERYGVKIKTRFHAKHVLRGIEIQEGLLKGQAIYTQTKEKHGLKSDPVNDDFAHAKYEQDKRAFKRVLKKNKAKNKSKTR